MMAGVLAEASVMTDAAALMEQMRGFYHVNYLAIALQSTGVGGTFLQALCWMRGLEIAETLAIASENVITAGAREIVEPQSTAHSYLRSVLYCVAWCTNVIVCWSAF